MKSRKSSPGQKRGGMHLEYIPRRGRSKGKEGEPVSPRTNIAKGVGKRGESIPREEGHVPKLLGKPLVR